MTKEELLKQSGTVNGSVTYFICTEDVKNFLESNVCIPKGGTLQANFDGDWTDLFTNDNEYELRIKPSEPIYEYLYEMWIPSKNALPTMHINGPYCTDDEASNSTLKQYGWSKNEKSKRERK